MYFVMTQPELWSHQSIYDEFERDQSFEPLVLVMPDTQDASREPTESTQRSLEVFREMGLRASPAIRRDGQIFSPTKIVRRASLLFFDQPRPGLGKQWMPHKLLMRSLLLYVPYGIKVSPDDRANFGLELHNFAWKIFAETAFHKRKFDALAGGPPTKTSLTGYPKFDFMPVAKVSGSDPITGIVAPHWSVRLQGWTYSTFENTSEQLFTLLADYPDIHWVLRPHQGLRSQVIKSGFMSVEEIDDYVERWNSATNGTLHYGPVYYPQFASSDFMITDCGSFLAEYVVTRKPLLHLNSPISPGYNSFGREVLSVNYESRLGDRISWFVENVVLSASDPLASRRARLAEQLLGTMADKIGKTIYVKILEELRLP